MIVKCEKCQAAFHLDDRLIKETGTKVRCSKCSHTFRVYPAEPVESQAPPQTEPESEKGPAAPSEPGATDATQRSSAPESGATQPAQSPSVPAEPGSGESQSAPAEAADPFETAEETQDMEPPEPDQKESGADQPAADPFETAEETQDMEESPGEDRPNDFISGIVRDEMEGDADGTAPAVDVPASFRTAGPAEVEPGTGATAPPPPTETGTDKPYSGFTMNKEQAPAVPETDQQQGPAKSQKGYIPFKYKLILFAGGIIAFLALIVVPIEGYRPFQQLKNMIQTSRNLIGGVQASFTTPDLKKMNEFTLDVIRNANLEADRYQEYFFLAFNMLIMEGEILPKDQVLERIDASLFGGKDQFKYDQLKEKGFFWKSWFARHPGVQALFTKYKLALIKADKAAKEAGFDELYFIYVMLDTGEKEGYFANQIASLVDSIPWWGEPGYCGEPYEGDDVWRAGALNDSPGFSNYPVHDPDHFYLPRFVEDEWGSWFTVWLTRETDAHYNSFNIDFNARVIKEKLKGTATVVAVIALVLIAVVMVVATLFSNWFTQPVAELSAAAQRVAEGDYEQKIELSRKDEFGELIDQFNIMMDGQQERMNLKVTLEKFLSEELAEIAGKEGIMLGGQKAFCTVMFTDFAGFSTITQQMSAAEAVEALNTYFDGMIPLVKRYGGFPDKYIGDAIVALFGSPVPLEDHAERAVACAIEMQWKIREINDQRRKEGRPIFEMRIGLNSGEVLAGAIGCDTKLEYTSIGETTNLANRMEAACPIGHVKIAEGTYNLVKGLFFKGAHISSAEMVNVKGYTQPVASYSVFVDDLAIKKDMQSKDIQSFYVYQRIDHGIKHHFSEVKGVEFDRQARYITEADLEREKRRKEEEEQRRKAAQSRQEPA